MKKIILIFSIFCSEVFTKGLPFSHPHSNQSISIEEKNYPSKKTIKEIQVAIKNFNNKKLEKMLQKGLSPNIYAPLKHSFTMLQFASSLQNIKAVTLLLKYGANPNILRDYESRYLMPIVYFLNDPNMLKLFLKHGASLNITQPYYPIIDCNNVDKLIEPPLFYTNTRESIKFLVLHGGNIYQRNIRGETILDTYTIKMNKDRNYKGWLMENYKLPKTYLRCSNEVNKIIKVVHTSNGYSEYDINETMVYEYNATK
jgi:hypothetical protein